MPRNLRLILGQSNRVRKPSRPARHSASSPAKASKVALDEDLFPDRPEDCGMAQLLAEELTLRDVVQAMRYIRSSMFTPVPQTGLGSTRVAELLNYCASMPPLVTLSHLDAILRSPTRTQRELAELVAKGVLRKVRVERRGAVGEAVVETAALEAMVTASGVSAATAACFLAFLRDSATAQTLPPDAPLTSAQTDELVRAGFLTSAAQATPATTLDVRPEDRTTLTSIQHVSRFASGTLLAVGGRGAIHLGGGGGGSGSGGSARTRPRTISGPGPGFRVAVQGHGRHLKLAEAAVGWLRDALARTRWGEAPEDWLRERFDGGGLRGARWRDFQGLEWQWLLGLAVGLGAAEVFETGSVGRGVRALGG